jgi:hypothetical protein
MAASTTLAACQRPELGAKVYDWAAGGTTPITDWPAVAPREFAVLNRLTFGPRAEERQRVSEIGWQAWIEEQLAPESIDDSGAALRLRRFSTLTMRATDLADWSDKLFDDIDRSPVPDELRQATLLRQVYSRRQLYELMVEFWTDHFNISVDKGDCFFLKTVDDRDVIRPHALGKFRDLLWASAHSPAMLIYLDNQANVKRHPNENYARELMELHTLGVNGGYRQEDVMELARCLTGWTVKAHWWRGEFTFDPEQHDEGVKTVLGMTIQPEGQREAERVLEKLAAHPSTARFIAAKLAQRFLGPTPAGLIDRAAEAFVQTDGDIRSVLRVILLDGLAAGPLQPLFKRPVHFIVSALRQLNAYTDGGPALHDYLARLGQTYFGWPTPDGYPDRAEAWQGNLLPRWQFALALAQNEIEGTQVDLPALTRSLGSIPPAASLDRWATLLLGAPLPVTLRDHFLSSLRTADVDPQAELPGVITAGLLASPAFQWR